MQYLSRSGSTLLTKPRHSLRDFVFRGLLFESEAERFRRAGIQVGTDLGKSEQFLLEETLQPFGITKRNNAIQMGRIYSLLHCFENEIRDLIRETLEETVGLNWWDKVPKRVIDFAESRKKTALEDSWLEGDKTDQLSFCDFGHLADIIVNFWEHFENLIPSQQWLKQRMDEIEKARNFIAHNRMLLPSEFDRLYMYISDWNKVIGL